MVSNNPKHCLFEHDYLEEIKNRLYNKTEILNLAFIQRQTGVSRQNLQMFMNGEIPSTISFMNVVKLYKFIEEQNI